MFIVISALKNAQSFVSTVNLESEFYQNLFANANCKLNFRV